MSSVAADDQDKRAADMSLAVWKHYEERIVLVKESFIKTTSLVLGFAAALLAWGAQHGINWSVGAKDPLNAPLVFVVAVGGLGLTIFAWHITNDAAVHLASNMERANRAAAPIPILSRVIGGERDHESPQSSSPISPESIHICRQARRIVAAFSFIFATCMLVALLQFCCCCPE